MGINIPDRLDTETGPAGNRNHDFDGNDNRTTDGAGTTATFTPNSDRIATINGIAVTLDAAGNITGDGSYQYVWDDLGDLKEVHLANGTLLATYYYDDQHLRTRKVTTAAAPQGASPPPTITMTSKGTCWANPHRPAPT